MALKQDTLCSKSDFAVSPVARYPGDERQASRKSFREVSHNSDERWTTIGGDYRNNRADEMRADQHAFHLICLSQNHMLS